MLLIVNTGKLFQIIKNSTCCKKLKNFINSYLICIEHKKDYAKKAFDTNKSQIQENERYFPMLCIQKSQL